MPFHCDDPRTDRWAMETLDEIYPFAADPNNALVNLHYVLSLKRSHEGPNTDDFVAEDYHKGTGGKSRLPSWSVDGRLKFQNMALEQVAVRLETFITNCSSSHCLNLSAVSLFLFCMRAVAKQYLPVETSVLINCAVCWLQSCLVL